MSSMTLVFRYQSGFDAVIECPAEDCSTSGATIRTSPKRRATDASAANNFARTLQIDDALAKRVKRWRRAKPIRLDLGMVTVRRRSRPFVEGVGGGLLAAAIVHGPEEVEDRSNSARDERRLALELLARLAKENEPERWEIELDGKDLSGDYIAVEALNI